MKKGTLFSYFKPVPSAASSPQPAKPRKSASKPQTEKTGEKALCVEGIPITVGMLVWAKMAGHPWWPGLVTPHPSTNAFKKGRKHIEVHVQFFGQPASRGWIPLTSLELFTNESTSAHNENESGFEEAKMEASQALKMAVTDRESLIVLIESDTDEMDQGKDGPFTTPASGKKRQHSLESEDGDSDTVGSKDSGCMSETPQPKRNRVRMLDSDASEDDYVPTSEGESDGESEDGKSNFDETLESECEEVAQDEDEGEEEEEPVISAKKRKSKANGGRSSKQTKSTVSTAKSPKSKGHSSTPKRRSSTASASAPTTDMDTSILGASGPRRFLHESLDWLSLEKRRDKEGRTVNDPDFNPRTLLVPREYLSTLTPGLRQWWDIKMDNFDTVLFMKVGKFYELYHMDAVTGVQELGLSFMKGDFAHSGFPEVAFGRYAQVLVQKGYKVARVEQTETPQMMEKRVKSLPSCSKFDRVVKRELCSIITQGTRTMSLFDGDIVVEEAAYLFAVKQKVNHR